MKIPASRDVIQQLLGHSKLESTQIYTEVSISRLQEIHARTHPAGLPERAGKRRKPGPENPSVKEK